MPAPAERKLTLIRAHPDLAGKAAIAGDLTAESSEEQASAGIDQCTPEEYAEFQALNSRYKEKFGFPFVMAVRNSNRSDILRAFATRLENDTDTEFATAIAEIHQIARMRLEGISKCLS
jgi:OHCU decarboxylase